MNTPKEVLSSLKLARPSLDLFPSFLEFVEDMRANGQPLWVPYLPKEDEAPENFIERLLKRETEPESPFVPETVFWAVCSGNVVGRISLRHRLEGNLYKMGGHIGYEVSPRWRKRGFATEMLRQVLLTPKATEIARVLLTCSPDNEASNKTIQRNGGVFEKKIFVDSIQESRNHYWIDCRSLQMNETKEPENSSVRKKSLGSHTRKVDGQKLEWFVEDLWRLAKDLPIVEIYPTSIIDLDRDGWFMREKPTPRTILNHMRRILDSDLSYPVILHPDGSIMDGAHRACKAILLGEKVIRVVRFIEVPAPSRITQMGAQ